ITVVLVDGRYVPSLCALPPLVDGMRIGSLARAIVERPDEFEPHLGKVATGTGRPFVDLSTALFEDGLLLHLRRGTCVPVPIDVIHVTTGPGLATFPRTLVVAESESRLTLVEHHVALASVPLETAASRPDERPAPYLTVPVTELALARNAAV